ncbi:MAG: MarR family transcriptional regulator [Clostridiaceae bacterium]|nr:MarR family transcriptional regulator [Clostridiaceae bacterium]
MAAVKTKDSHSGAAALRLGNQLCFPLYAASRQVIRLYTPLLDPLKLTYTQYITLLALWEQDGLAVKDLGQLLYLDSGTLTPLLKKLEQQGLISRKRSGQDERVVTVHLTDAGHALNQRALDVPRQVASCIPLEREDAIQLKRLLERILGA